MKKLVTTIALLLWASQAWAQQSTQAGGTGCSTPATAARLGVMSPTIGTVCTITDGASATDCTTGGGTDKVTCFYCGAAWQSSSCGGASGGTDVALDLGDTGSNDSAAINEIATSGDTNNIFTEPAADKLLINVSQNWPVCDAATAADDLSASCNQCVDISANTNLSVGAGLFLNGTSDQITVISNASGFLADGGTSNMTCSGLPARIQVMDDGSLQYCDGATTSVLQSYDPGTTLTAGTGLTGDFVIDTSSTINCDNAAADGSTKGCSTFKAADFVDDGSGLITIQDKFVLTGGDDMSGDLTITDVAAGSVLTLTGLEGEDTLLLASENATSPANNDTVSLAMSVENSANTQVVGGRIFMQMVDVTSGSEESQMSFDILDDQSANPITPLKFTNSASGLPSVTVNPNLTDIDFIHWSAPAGGPVQTIACDAGTGVCNFANSPTVAGGADPTYVAVVGDAMSGALDIDTTVANALQVYADTGGDSNYAQMGCAGTGGGNSRCNMTFTADNNNGNEAIIAMLRHQIVDTTFNSIDGKMEILLKSNGTIESMQHWLSDAGGTKTVLVNPANLDVDFRVYGDTNNNMFACDGSTEVCEFLNPPLGLSETTMTKFQTGPVGSEVSDQESNGNVSCVKWFVPGRMAEINIADIVVDTGNGTSTVEFGVFSADGQTQFFECTVAPNTTNGSYECSNTLSAPLIPVRPQDVWICVSTNSATFDAESTHATLSGARYCKYSQAATGGAMPTTLTSNPTCTWSAMRPLYVGLSDR